MEKINEFFNHFINIETTAEERLRKNDIQIHNDLIRQVFDLSGPDVKLANIEELPLSAALERMIQRNKDIAPRPRHFYKIGEYAYPKYGKIWACYTSVANPISGPVKLLSTLYMIAYIEEQLKIIAQFKVDHDTYKWRFVGGDRDIKYYKLGKPVAVERLLSPEDDEWSIEEYLKDK
jgi:hypothetical protein